MFRKIGAFTIQRSERYDIFRPCSVINFAAQMTHNLAVKLLPLTNSPHFLNYPPYILCVFWISKQTLHAFKVEHSVEQSVLFWQWKREDLCTLKNIPWLVDATLSQRFNWYDSEVLWRCLRIVYWARWMNERWDRFKTEWVGLLKLSNTMRTLCELQSLDVLISQLLNRCTCITTSSAASPINEHDWTTTSDSRWENERERLCWMHDRLQNSGLTRWLERMKIRERHVRVLTRWEQE